MNKTISRILAIAFIILIAVGLFFYYSTKVTIPAAKAYTTSNSVNSNSKVDNSFLKINLNENDYKLSFFRQYLVTTDMAEVEKFINDNIEKVEQDKIIVYSDLDKKEFKEINLILKKHGVDRFRINE